jgi:hypothetical protein
MASLSRLPGLVLGCVEDRLKHFMREKTFWFGIAARSYQDVAKLPKNWFAISAGGEYSGLQLALNARLQSSALAGAIRSCS